ncbi:aminotransferase class V-fold PLP-dependent enzyme [Kitasatospora sp. NBC_01287]|uniref:aminotransferase class V-fold PLP-dependent enzyme n=1 Tax=Kitasatospora sp. NBC_01287 TaxID=2903573 RepID=UPI002259463A|nr:aminotransferase class V-fold PLP-dependent enzyme [Kitasatospora sp. NBC_01287]MCX4750196.1 aminotransferase class V-fold PLP-dependent enzyme [Kitasatospora sp. NBC_01287]
MTETPELPSADAPEPIPGAAELFTLDPAVAHLNHGSYGAVPAPVREAQRRLSAEQEADPDAFFAVLPERVAAARTELAPVLGADPLGLALVSNVTEAVAVVLDSIPFGPGDEILVTDHGYGVVTRAAERRAAECGARVRVVPVPLELLDPAPAVLDAVTERTKVALLDRITSPTARELATPPLLRALAERGVLTMVDAAHVPGMLAPDLEVGRPDFWFGNLHKWAFAPRPTALLAVTEAWRERIRPLTYSWEHEHGFPFNVEWRGTADYTGWLAAPTALRVLEGLGVERVREHNVRLAAYGQRRLVELTGLPPLPGSERLAMRAVRLPAGVAEDEAGVRQLMRAVGERLGSRVAVRPWVGGGVLRISAQVYNRAEEYEKLAAGLGELLRAG